MAREIFDQSCSLSWPLRNRLASMRPSEPKMRCVSSRWPISNEKKSTGLCDRSAALAAAPNANEVLPMAGRAPTTINAFGCSPAVSTSRSVYPDGVPVIASPRS